MLRGQKYLKTDRERITRRQKPKFQTRMVDGGQKSTPPSTYGPDGLDVSSARELPMKKLIEATMLALVGELSWGARYP